MRLIFYAFPLCALLLVSAHSSYDRGFEHSNLHVVRTHGDGPGQDVSLEKALKLLASGQAAMARANRAIIANPRQNRLEVLNATELARAATAPPPLDYTAGNGTSLNARATRDNSTQKDMRYTLPDELVEAARLVSETWTAPDDDDGYATTIRELQSEYKPITNDTNMMPPMLQYGSGLTARVEEPPSAFRYGNDTTVSVNSTSKDDGTQRLDKRSSNDWWMATIQQRGSSPFAPTGYKVWRNVKDYGAKGDGVSDDTEAINEAISSGGRCGGGDCTGSTIYPATVYFPPGRYKVSSPIIQYYNTEIVGNPFELPKIVAAPSFVGLGVITSNVYTGETSEWYLNQNNFLRSVRNLIVDIRATPQWAQVCGIHWQVAQATSLENIHFYMTKPEDDPSTTQQGIYMENGSGGFLSDLYFVGGKFGAYMGNQQFTASGLYFQNAETAIQIHWDWGWTMQNIVIVNCQNGLTIVGGAGGPMSNGQGIGSLLVTDMQMRYGKVGISTSVMSDNSTALLLSNSGFYAVDTIVKDSTKNQVLLAGSSRTMNVEAWGFGRVSSADGNTNFLNGADLDSPGRDVSLVLGPRKQFFTRRRPKYDNLGFSQIFDVKAYGARGDGTTDDTAVLNHIFAAAANMSAVVYIPFGVYLIKDTIEIPVGSRVIGQAWPQIMATGSKFADALKPRVAVRVGQPGQVGVVEIQSLMLTVKGATAGAVMMEWNVHESVQGSAGLWDTHFRVGGAAGTDLTAKDCPKLSGKVNSNCIAASLMLHLTPQSSAYLENVWMWTADHDFDTADQTQIDIYAGRGMLVESKGPTWLWGTSVEHCVLYQYQLSNAQNIVMGLIQTESPYFQSFPAAPLPFIPGAFPNDPEFHDCSLNSKTCGVSWAVRFIDSSAIHVLSAGLYSFFSRYDQSCLDSGRHDCQDKIFYTEQSFNVWVYNLVTLGSIEMVSPLNGVPTLGKPNRNGFASSILAWFGGAKQVTGLRDFSGYRIYPESRAGLEAFPEACQTALSAPIRCDNATRMWVKAAYHGPLPAEVDIDSVCDAGCARSISDWRKSVDTYCAGSKWSNGAAPGVIGSFISYGINETCQIEKSTGKYCSDVITQFSDAADTMPTSVLCSDCYLARLKMMQESPYSIYGRERIFQDALKAAVSRCSLTNQPTTTQDSPYPKPTTETPFCLSGIEHTVQKGDTCDSLALHYSVASASIFTGNPQILECDNMVEGETICLPLQCETYQLKSRDTCASVRAATGQDNESIMRLNPWIDRDCRNLQNATQTLGSVLCISVPGGDYSHNTTNETSDPAYSAVTRAVVAPPSGAIVPEDTTKLCGAWQTVQEGDDCAQILVRHHIDVYLFTRINPSISRDSCTADLEQGVTYCVNPADEFFATSLKYYVPEYYRYGCYAHNTTLTKEPVLRDRIVSGYPNMTLILCMAYCREYSLGVFGLENGDSCLCDTRLRMDNELLEDSKCNTPCNGNSTDAQCGGEGAVQVYSNWWNLMIEHTSLGCYVQDQSKLPLGNDNDEGDSFEASTMSIEKCGTYCGSKGKPFFGLSEGSRCTCGNQLQPWAKPVDIEECDVDCSDERGDICGGKNRVEVFTTKSPAVSQDFNEPGPIPTYEEFGCYNTDNRGVTGLTHSQLISERGMTVQDCARYCLVTQGQTLFGLEEGYICRCGSKLQVGTEGGYPPQACHVACSGNSTESCGGYEMMSVFGVSRSNHRPLAYSHDGCFSHEAGLAAWGKADSMEMENLTIEGCAKECAGKFEPQSELIFSLDGGNRCSCALSSPDINLETPTTRADCNIPCAGESEAWCGGEKASNVYHAWS